MRWLRDAGWLVALGAVIVVLAMRPERTKLPDPNESRAAIEKARSDFEAQKAKREQELDLELSRIRTEGTQDLLRMVGRAYRQHLAAAKTPPQAADFQDVLSEWKSSRDGKPFGIQWGVDLARLPDGGTGMVLAWEQTADKDGSRCVLMADAKSVKVVSNDEFNKLPRAR